MIIQFSSSSIGWIPGYPPSRYLKGSGWSSWERYFEPRFENATPSHWAVAEPVALIPRGTFTFSFRSLSKAVALASRCLWLWWLWIRKIASELIYDDLALGIYIYINNIVIYLSMYLCYTHTYIYIYMCVCVVCVWIEASYVNVFEPCQLVERQWTSLGVPRNSNNQEAKARPQGSRHLARGRMGCFFKYSFVEGMWRIMYEQL